MVAMDIIVGHNLQQLFGEQRQPESAYITPSKFHHFESVHGVLKSW